MTVTALLLSRFFRDEADFHYWTRHHLEIGFDHIHVFDNGNPFGMYEACRQYGTSLSYEKVSSPQQYHLYNQYIYGCSADYVMPVDDDEFLWVHPDLGTVQNAIDYYSSKWGPFDTLGIRWLFKFPAVFHSERTCTVLQYCTEENDYVTSRFYGNGNNIIKCIVKKSAFIRYLDVDESRTRNHIPLTSDSDGAMLCNGHYTDRQNVPNIKQDEKIRLIHCPFQGYSDYMNKQKHHLTVSSKIQKPRTYGAFNYVLPKLA